MPFLPKKEERYFAALRLIVQKSVLKHGITDQNIRRLKKIYLAEAVFLRNEKQATELLKYANILLGSANLILFSRGITVQTVFSGNGVAKIDRRLFAAFLIFVAARTENGGSIAVMLHQNKVSVRVTGLREDQTVEKLQKAIKATCLKTANGSSHLFYWQVEPTNKPPVSEQDEWLYLTDGFSAVNVYLENVLGGTQGKP